VRWSFRDAEGIQVGPSPNQNFSMGSKISVAHKVFVDMAAREKVSNF
jgi:hypothetical protein